MKKFLLLVALLPFVVIGCSDDEDSSPITGVWMQQYYWGYSNKDKHLSEKKAWHECNLLEMPIYEFKKDGTYNYYDTIIEYRDKMPDITKCGTYKLVGQTLYLTGVGIYDVEFTNEGHILKVEEKMVCRRVTKY